VLPPRTLPLCLAGPGILAWRNCGNPMLQMSVGETEVSIVAQNKDCYESGIVCIKFLVIHVGLTKIYFTDNSGNPSPSTVIGRGSEFELWKAGYYTVVHFPNQDLTILWDHKTTVHITAGPRWKGLLTGLCGNFDSVTVNDMTTSSHMEVNNAQTFGDSWALGQCESDYVVERPCEGDLGRQPYAKRECALLYSDVFAPCHNVVDVAWFYRNCLTDTCNCNRGGDCECLCTSIAAYAHKCCQQGITIQWRSPSVCQLGSGPFSLVSAVSNDTIFGVNRTSNAVIPLTRGQRPGQFPPPDILFNFMITAGLQKDKTSRVPVISLESAERPNYFLAVSGDGHLQMEHWSQGTEFSRRATFIQHQGLFLPGLTAFELVGQPGTFLTLAHTFARAKRYDNTDSFKISSSFTLEGQAPGHSPHRIMCEWRYQACSNPCAHTCSDPDAARCQFLPPVEGCFPRCPKNMVLDEVTRRCVYTEDCENVCVLLPPTPTSFSYVTRSNRTTPTPATTTTVATTLSPPSTTATVSTATTRRATPSTTQRSTTTTASVFIPTTAATEHVTTSFTTLFSTVSSTTVTSSAVSQPTLPEVATPEKTSTPSASTAVTMAATTVTSSTVSLTSSPPFTTSPAPTAFLSSTTLTVLTASASSPPAPTPTPLTSPTPQPPPSTTMPTASTTSTHPPNTTTPQPTSMKTIVITDGTTPTDGVTVPTVAAPTATSMAVTTEPTTSPDTSPTTEEVSTTHPSLMPTTPCTVSVCFALGNSSNYCVAFIFFQLTTQTGVYMNIHAMQLLSPQPPYSYRIDECAELICFNGQLLLHNSSLHCHYNTTQPQCSLLGLPILINTDPCCPQWQCPCRCTVMSDLRVITFDGNNVALYDNGSFVLVNLPTETIIGTVEKCPTSQSPTGGTSGLCFKRLNITTAAYRIIINRLDRKVTINYRNARLPFSRQSLYVEDTGSMYLIQTPGGVSIQWYHSTGILVLQYITTYNASVPTRGLCGCCDGNPEDDLRLPNGTVVRELGDMMLFLQAWRVPTTDESEHMRRIGDNCTTGDCSTCLSMLYQRAFMPCHSKVPPEQFCDIMWAGDLHYKDHQCDFLAAYVAVCYTHQVCISWRRHNFCPLRCPPGKEYQPCVSTCTSRTCLNREYYEESTCSFVREECVCRSGTILHRADSPYCVTEDRCVCESCIEPIPTCSRGEILAVDINNTYSCCPHYYCVCDVSLCPESSVSCAPGLTLVQATIAGNCCPQYHCG
uniref:Otogelin like n=1 Tax=Tetraodon nigroviridis TaxID=99883 RepID=H3C5Q2_TETNG